MGNTMETLLTLDDLLAHNCPAEELPDGSKRFRIELHCVTYHITAKLMGYTPDPHRQTGRRPQYIIQSYTTETS
jgi:hypothetical protein